MLCSRRVLCSTSVQGLSGCCVRAVCYVLLVCRACRVLIGAHWPPDAVSKSGLQVSEKNRWRILKGLDPAEDIVLVSGSGVIGEPQVALPLYGNFDIILDHFRAFFSSTPPYTRCGPCSTSCPGLPHADWCLHSDVMPNSGLQASRARPAATGRGSARGCGGRQQQPVRAAGDDRDGGLDGGGRCRPCSICVATRSAATGRG